MIIMERDWSRLPNDLLQEIDNRVAMDAVDDYIRFRAVCTSWRSATLEPHRLKIPDQLPRLMLTFDEVLERTRSFYRPSDDKIITLDLPEVLNHRIVGSSDGWLVLVHESGAVCLFNPLTKARIDLPALTTLPLIWGYREEEVGYEYTLEFDFPSDTETVRDCFVNKLITFSEDGHIMLVAMLVRDELVFARVGDDEWTFIDKSPNYRDMLFYRGTLYALDQFRVLVSVDIAGGPSVSVETLTAARDERRGFLWYLTPVGKDLLLVGRYYGHDLKRPLHISKRLEIFKLAGKKMTRVESLGDWALFVGTNRAMSFNVKGHGHRGWKKDCIYFTPSYFASIGAIYKEDGLQRLSMRETILEYST